MDKLRVKNEIQKLSREIEEHNDRYYVLDEPAISDKEYDDLLKRLIKLEEQFPECRLPDSPTQRVGVKLKESAKSINHKAKMYSLDNVYCVEELKEWQERVIKGLPGEDIEYVA